MTLKVTSVTIKKRMVDYKEARLSTDLYTYITQGFPETDKDDKGHKFDLEIKKVNEPSF